MVHENRHIVKIEGILFGVNTLKRILTKTHQFEVFGLEELLSEFFFEAFYSEGLAGSGRVLRAGFSLHIHELLIYALIMLPQPIGVQIIKS